MVGEVKEKVNSKTIHRPIRHTFRVVYWMNVHKYINKHAKRHEKHELSLLLSLLKSKSLPTTWSVSPSPCTQPAHKPRNVRPCVRKKWACVVKCCLNCTYRSTKMCIGEFPKVTRSDLKKYRLKSHTVGADFCVLVVVRRCVGNVWIDMNWRVEC